MKKALIFIACFCCLATLAQADLKISSPHINGKAVTNVEAGASPKFYVEYTNKTGKEVEITSGQINLIYNPKVISEVAETSLPNTATEPGQISLIIEEPIKVKKDETKKIAWLTVQMQSKSSLTNKWLIFLDWSRPVLFAGTENVTGRLSQPEKKYYEQAKPPEFIGLSEVTSANSFGDKNPGNTLLLDWRTPAGAFDLTKYPTKKGERLHFKVFRSLDSLKWEELSSEGEPPYPGNQQNVDYVYEDTNLDDGTQYFYRVDAVDALGNEKQGAILAGVPKDLTAPKEITNLSGLAQDNQIILKWQNPQDKDLGGVIILRNENKPVATKALETGKEYYVGDLPFGREKGEVVFASFQEDFDPSMVPNEFIDDYVEPKIEYYYTIYTYDRATVGPPAEMGRNYSRGIAIAMTTQGQVNRPLSQPSAINGGSAQNQSSVRLTDTPVLFPNPFKPSGNNKVTLQYSLSKNSSLDLIITDLSLRIVKKISIFAGEPGGQNGLNKVDWDGRDELGVLAANGPYLINIFAKEENKIIGKMRLTVYR